MPAHLLPCALEFGLESSAKKLVHAQQESGLFPCLSLLPGEQDQELSGSAPENPQGMGQTLASRCSSPCSGVTLEATRPKSGVVPTILGFPESKSPPPRVHCQQQGFACGIQGIIGIRMAEDHPPYAAAP